MALTRHFGFVLILAAVVLAAIMYISLRVDGCVVTDSGVHDLDGFYSRFGSEFKRSPLLLLKSIPDIIGLSSLAAASRTPLGRRSRSAHIGYNDDSYELVNARGEVFFVGRDSLPSSQCPPRKGWLYASDPGTTLSHLRVLHCSTWPTSSIVEPATAVTHQAQVGVVAGVPVGGRGGSGWWKGSGGGGGGNNGGAQLLLKRPATALLLALNLGVALWLRVAGVDAAAVSVSYSTFIDAGEHWRAFTSTSVDYSQNKYNCLSEILATHTHTHCLLFKLFLAFTVCLLPIHLPACLLSIFLVRCLTMVIYHRIVLRIWMCCIYASTWRHYGASAHSKTTWAQSLISRPQ